MISDFVLIIGAMKSGTTTLYNYLTQHPQISIGPDKEPGFFAFEEKWALGIDWYESRFDYDPSKHLYALDGSTDYTKYPFCKDVVERLKSTAPRRFKLIYIMRHPLRRIESQALHAELTKSEIGYRISPRKTHSLDAGISPAAIAFSLYAYQIDQFSEYYDKGQLLLLTLEQLIREPHNVLEKVSKFLEIENQVPRDTSLKSNPISAHYGPPPIWHALSQIKPWRSIARTIVPKTARRYIYDIANLATQPSGRFILNPDEERVITAMLASDLVRLRDTYNIDAQKEWRIDLAGA